MGLLEPAGSPGYPGQLPQLSHSDREGVISLGDESGSEKVLVDTEEGGMDAPGEVLVCDEALTLEEDAGDVGQLGSGQGEHSEGTLQRARYLGGPELFLDVEPVGDGGKDTEADLAIAT